MNELNKILDDNEKVLWSGKPVQKTYIWGQAILPMIFGAFWLMIIMVQSLIMIFFPVMWICQLPFYAVGVGLLFGTPIFLYYSCKNTEYAITDKRVIIQQGAIGRDFRTIDFDQITDAEVNVGFFDKFFNTNTGSIYIYTASSIVYTRRGAYRRGPGLVAIENPYEVFKYFKKVAHDVKTDIEYPNKFRPGENPGYGTQYKPTGKKP